MNEKIEAVNYLIDNNIGADKLIPGTGLCSIKDTVIYSKAIAKLKVKAILVLPAFYYKNVSNEGVVEFYKRVIEEVGDSDLKYILYNIPQVSGVSIGLEVIEQLIKLFPNNVVGMKESSGNLDNMLKITKYFNNFSLFSGSDSLALESLSKGRGRCYYSMFQYLRQTYLIILLITIKKNLKLRTFNYFNNYKSKFVKHYCYTSLSVPLKLSYLLKIIMKTGTKLIHH